MRDMAFDGKELIGAFYNYSFLFVLETELLFKTFLSFFDSAGS